MTKTNAWRLRLSAFLVCAIAVVPAAAVVTHSLPPLTARQVKAIIATAHPGTRPNLSARDLSGLDLTAVAFHGARLDRANMFEAILIGADLSQAQMDGANLSSVKMDRARASGALLRGATFLTTAADANFERADLSRSSGYLIAPGAVMRHAIIRRAKLAPDLSNQPMGMLHTILARANLEGADLSFSDLSFADLNYADFRKALVRGTNFHGADLSAADFTGADVTGANFAQADLTDAVFARVRGRSAMRGLGTARNLDTAIFRR
ncbi:MAG TPA: pentapeptide repeat-containing protein [Candidatus Acidoferrales bacterium]|nr:pentapeptide repeat-containing protein [Candidatus Acidoferrales bacterium]